MDCETIKKSLGSWLDVELADSEAAKIKAHLEICAECAEEKRRLIRLQASIKDVLESRASGIAFEPFWRGVRSRILEKRPWYVALREMISGDFLSPQRLAWTIPVGIALILALLSLDQFSPWGSQKNNLTSVESIDGHGFNVAVFRESQTKTTVIWLFENQEDEDEPSGESTPPGSSF
ncbi:MAG: zf-HC2 domain-containing protein [Deltaproteobacteria bacterium]|nr:zf-HC2 domain-containing protein [Deltaproteobacteria bacterium]